MPPLSPLPASCRKGSGRLENPKRNFDFLRRLIDKELSAGRLNGKFDSNELTMGFYGLMNIYVMAELVSPRGKLNRATAERIIELFCEGAGVLSP